MTEACVALLGRRDAPTDAVAEYCQYLGEALQVEGIALELVRVAWNETGWRAALRDLQGHARAWRGRWVLVQYTTLAWSERGFPQKILGVLRVLRDAGARVAMVYHDPLPFPGRRVIDKLRAWIQTRVMREALEASELGVFTVPPSKIGWIGKSRVRIAFIPVGANLVNPERAWAARAEAKNPVPAVVVYGITGGEGGKGEIAAIAEALQTVTERIGQVRLVAIGRNSDTAEQALRDAIRNQPVEVSALGVLPAEEVVGHMAKCDVMLFVRGGISTRRGSAIAGIACGLPVVALEGPETGEAITEAGVLFANPKNERGIGEALLRILNDRECREALAEKSRRAQERYFSWNAIAGSYARALRGKDGEVGSQS